MDRSGRHDRRVAVYWPCQSGEKISNYFFGLINVTLFGIIFFQIQLYASLLLQVFSLPRIFTAGMRGRDKPVRTRRS